MRCKGLICKHLQIGRCSNIPSIIGVGGVPFLMIPVWFSPNGLWVQISHLHIFIESVSA